MFTQSLFGKASKFAISGIGSTLIHVVVALALLRLLMAPPAIANGIAYFVATVFSYTANTLWSFGQKVTRQNAARFVQASAFGVVLSMLISGAADLAGFSDLCLLYTSDAADE